MRSTSTCTLLFFLTFISTMEARNYELNSCPKPSKYHQTYLAIEKDTDGNEIDRLTITPSNKKTSQAGLLKYEQVFLKMKKYQERLIALGFDINSIASAYDETIKTHHHYLLQRTISVKS